MNAPVVVFAYNRPEHLNKTLSALSQNKGASESDVFLFVDGPKTDAGKQKQDEVINVAKNYVKGFFKSFNITVSEKNKGLAKSVIGGVSQILDRFGKVIVIEDDAISAENYLEFMNSALEFYKNDKTVWSVGGFTVPMNLPSDYRDDVIKTQRVSSYAWGVWKDRWDRIDWEVKEYPSFSRSIIKRVMFNKWGLDRSAMLDDQISGIIDSWAIRFDYAMFKCGMYNIVPRYSLIKTIGHDGSGTHSKAKTTEKDLFKTDLSKHQKNITLSSLDIDNRIRKEFCKPFYCSLAYRIKKYFFRKKQTTK